MQVANIVGLSCRDLQLHRLNLNRLLCDDAEATIKELLGGPLLRHIEGLFLGTEVFDAIQGKDAWPHNKMYPLFFQCAKETDKKVTRKGLHRFQFGVFCQNGLAESQ